MKKLLFACCLFFIAHCITAQDLKYYLPDSVTYNPAIPKPKDIIYHEVGEWENGMTCEPRRGEANSSKFFQWPEFASSFRLHRNSPQVEKLPQSGIVPYYRISLLCPVNNIYVRFKFEHYD